MVQIKDENLYYVGGVVRDEILGIPSIDIDYCYEGNAIEFASNLNVIKINPKFGTVRVMIENQEIDIASTRTEYYPKAGHLPIVKSIGCTLEEDLTRRDFTINALAKNTLTGELIDYFNGLDDIKTKKLKVLHDKSFIDDPTRIIRALKFSVRFGFTLDANTLKLQNEYLSNINYDMCYHRLKKELKETFNLNKIEALEKFIDQGLYKLLNKTNIESIKINKEIEKLIEEFPTKNIWLVYLGLFNLSNLELDSEERSILESYNKIKNIKPTNDIEAYKTFKQIPIESVMLYTLADNFDIGYNYLKNLQYIKLEINGDDLLKLGIKQGKIFQEIFEFVLEEKINKNIKTKAEELQIVKEKFL